MKIFLKYSSVPIILLLSGCTDFSASNTAKTQDSITYKTLDKLLAPSGEGHNWFGYSVAVSNDKIVVGAWGDGQNGALAGAAFIYNTDGTYVTKLVAPDGETGDAFGSSVAISNNKIVVGAFYDDDKKDKRKERIGSAYIFNTDGTYVAKIVAPDGANHDEFGGSVSISNDKIVVGACGSDSDSAYIFNTDGTYVTKLVAPDAEKGTNFGASVAISNNKIVVGASGDGQIVALAGAAFTYNIDGTYVTKITSPDEETGDGLGWSVAIYNGKVVVGSSGNNDNKLYSSSAYIFNIE